VAVYNRGIEFSGFLLGGSDVRIPVTQIDHVSVVLTDVERSYFDDRAN
jgi:hypothetical protein